MKILSVTNPIYSSSDKLSIDCIVQFDKLLTPVLFGANPKDPEDYGKQLYADLVAGKYGPIADYHAPVSKIIKTNLSTGSGPTVL
jgi:hypothetical protein